MVGSSKWFSLLLGAALLTAFVGCGVNEHLSDEGVLSASKSPLEAIGYFFGGIALAAGGWFMTQVWARIGIAMIVLGCLGTLYMAPAALFEKAIADSEHFVSSQGFLGMTHHEVMMKDLDHIQFVTETRRSRRGGTSYDHYMVCHCKGGEQKKIQVDSDVQQPAAFHFLQLADENGIRIEGLD
ncbi:hypothetical protein [Blastopirellula marina]|uniref:Uncharacterized protein n=1 Tax=Blastopirellula marina DSM 3645 TaxID=314230 RepID=A3ZM25_9BACT|nr:hypothetical protein [Blastopirellula marina]EAQ82808.1 hypothetical protein DSM3645_10422 [Blastopirellula marina DSM 3645]